MKVNSFFNSSVKIIENIWQVGGSDLSGPGDAAIYLVRFGRVAALIDSGCGEGHTQLLENIFSCIGEEAKLSHLFLTHCHFDHSGGARALRDQFGCPIFCHALDAIYLEQGNDQVTAASWYGAAMPPFAVDANFRQKETAVAVGGGKIFAYHCPGHSPGSVVYVVEKNGKKVLFGQDVHGPLHPDLLSNRQHYLESLKFILDLSPDILCEGHFGVFRGKHKVRRFISSYLN